MKRLLLITLVALFGLPLISNAQEQKWFIDTGVNLSVTSADGQSASSVSLGLGLHRMLGEKFSMGLNLAYTKSGLIDVLEVDLAFAYYCRINDYFYYVPQLATGPTFLLGTGAIGFGAALSPLGLEFRPTPRLGFRTSIINLTYMNLEGLSVWDFRISPSLSMIIRF